VKLFLLTQTAVLAFLLVYWHSQSISVQYQPIGKDGDYRVSISGGRQLVCEEQDVTIAQQPTAVDPIILECKHKEQP
jgi:hypothetical protein